MNEPQRRVSDPDPEDDGVGGVVPDGDDLSHDWETDPDTDPGDATDADGPGVDV